MPYEKNQRLTYQSLHPQLVALADEVSGQARPRPLLAASPGVIRIARRLLRQVCVLLGRPLPGLPGAGEITLGDLSASLGQARAALETFGAEMGFNENATPKQSREMLELRKKLARRIDELREGRL